MADSVLMKKLAIKPDYAVLRPVSLVAIDDTLSALRFRPTSDVVSRQRA